MSNIYLKAFDTPSNTDDGTRPLPAGTVFWESPAIDILGPDGNPTYELRNGLTYKITLHVANRKVSGNYTSYTVSTGLVLANPFTSDFHVEENLGEQTGLHVEGPGGDAALRFFTPSVLITGDYLHRCLLARAWAEGVDSPPDYSQAELFATGRVAQRNITLLPASTMKKAAGAPGGRAAMAIDVGNRGGAPQQMNLTVEPLGQAPLVTRVLATLPPQLGPRFLPAIDVDRMRLLLNASKPLLTVPAPHLASNLHAAPQQVHAAPPAVLSSLQVAALRAVRADHFSSAKSTLRAPLAAGTRGQVLVELPPPPARGELRGVRVMHRDDQGQLLGGVTLLFWGDE